MTGITKEGLILCSDGDVQELDLSKLEAVLAKLAQPGFFNQHCLVLGDCSKCRLPACPITGQG